MKVSALTMYVVMSLNSINYDLKKSAQYY